MAASVASTTASVEETRDVAAALARVVGPGDLVALLGPLGSGKTELVRGVCDAWEVPHEAGVSSPTFTLVNLYEGGRWPIAHVDLYRLEHPDELEAVGFRDLLAPDRLVLVEWADHAEEIVELATFEVRLEEEGPESRRITVRSPDPEALQTLRQELRARGRGDPPAPRRTAAPRPR